MKKPQKKLRNLNPVHTRARLLQATIKLVAEKGVAALSMKEAAVTADVSRAAAYQHFESRDHLLREAKAWVSGRLLESLLNLDSTSDSMEERVEHVAWVVLNNREASKLLLADAHAGKDLDADHPLYKWLLQVLQQFKASDRARPDIDVEMMSFIMLGSLSTLIMLRKPRADADITPLVKRFTREWTQILRHGIFR